MITGVPSAQELNDTAIGWLNLAWTSTIGCLNDVSDFKAYLDDGLGVIEDREILTQKIIRRQKFRINNAFSLFLQSLELFLKAKIAEVSPFLLISGEPKNWPKSGKSNQVDFSDFRTVDATDLCKIVSLVSQTKLSDKFVQLYNDLRVSRNKIAHLDTGKITIESSNILTSILKAHSLLFDGQSWQQFRQSHMAIRTVEDEYDFYEPDTSHDIYLNEIDHLKDNLQPKLLKEFLRYTKRKKSISCPNCENLTSKYYSGDHSYAQQQEDGSIFCVACAISYADFQTYETFRDVV